MLKLEVLDQVDLLVDRVEKAQKLSPKLHFPVLRLNLVDFTQVVGKRCVISFECVKDVVGHF